MRIGFLAKIIANPGLRLLENAPVKPSTATTRAFDESSLPQTRFCLEVQPGAGHCVYTGNETTWEKEKFTGCTPAITALNNQFPFQTHKLFVLNSMSEENQLKAITAKKITSNIHFICDPNGLLKDQFPHAEIDEHVVYRPGFYMFDMFKGQMTCIYENPNRTSIVDVLKIINLPTEEVLALSSKAETNPDKRAATEDQCTAVDDRATKIMRK